MSGEVSSKLEKKQKTYLSDCNGTLTHNHLVCKRTLERVCDMIKTNTAFHILYFQSFALSQIDHPFNRIFCDKSKIIHDKNLKFFNSV